MPRLVEPTTLTERRAQANDAPIAGSNHRPHSHQQFIGHPRRLIDDDQIQLAELLIQRGPAMPRPATLRDALGHVPSEADVTAALFAAVRADEDPHASEIDGDSCIVERARQLRARYLDDSWTWRR